MVTTTTETQQQIEMYDLKFLTDTCIKLEYIFDHVTDNIDFNLYTCNRAEEELPYQYTCRADITGTIQYIEDSIVNEFAKHPLHEWSLSIGGINPVLMGKIAGSIRFSPPKRNSTSNSTGRERWAHSLNALLTFSGLENRNNKNTKANQSLNRYIISQTEELIVNNNKYKELYEKYESSIENFLMRQSDFVSLDVHRVFIRNESLRNTATYFMEEVYNFMTK